MLLQDVALEKVNLTADKFRITFRGSLDALTASVKRIGVINPPLLMESGEAERFIVICGYRRLLACRTLSVSRVRAWVYRRGEIDDLGAFLTNLFDNLSIRDLNDIEKSIVVRKLLFDFKMSRERVIREYLPLLKISPHGVMLEKYLKLDVLEEALKKALATGEIAFPTAARLSGFTAADRSAVFTLITGLKLGINRQKELIEWLEESSHRDAMPIAEILKDPEIQSLAADEQLPLAQRAERLRWVLRQRRYPRLSAAEERFAEGRRRLDLPEKIALTHAAFFEENRLKIQFEFASAAELAEMAQRLQRAAQSSELADLLDLL
jgi:ParB-like chromosome segregation protein Spo0J